MRAQNSLREQANAIKADIDGHVASLTDAKTDRRGLAGMFSEIASRLAQDD